MSNGKGTRPVMGYNYEKYAEGYDRIFKPRFSKRKLTPPAKPLKCKKNPTK